MKKTEIVKSIKAKAAEAGVKLTMSDVDVVLDAVYATIVDGVASGEKVKINEITYSLKEVPERRGISQLGDKAEWVKPAHLEVAVKASKALKTAVTE